MKVRSRQQLFGTAPAPVAFSTTRYVHSSLSPEIEQVLERSDGERCRRGPREAHQIPRDLAAFTFRRFQVSPQILPLVRRQLFIPSAARGIIMRPRIYDRVRDVVVRKVRVI